MTHENSTENIKIRNTFLIKLSSKKVETQVKFTKWLNAQDNPQNSFPALIEHMIDRFGYEDIMDHEIAKKLYNERLHFNNPVNTTVIQQTTPSEQSLKVPARVIIEAPEVIRKEDSTQTFINTQIDEDAY